MMCDLCRITIFSVLNFGLSRVDTAGTDWKSRVDAAKWNTGVKCR